jgi:hypothetical protein
MIEVNAPHAGFFQNTTELLLPPNGNQFKKDRREVALYSQIYQRTPIPPDINT